MYRGLDTSSRNPAFIFTISASNVSQEFYIIGARLRLHVYSCCDRDIGQIPWFSRKYRIRATKPYPTDRLSVSIIIIGRIIGDTLMLNRANVPRDVPVAQSAGMFRYGIDRQPYQSLNKLWPLPDTGRSSTRSGKLPSPVEIVPIPAVLHVADLYVNASRWPRGNNLIRTCNCMDETLAVIPRAEQGVGFASRAN